MDDVFLAMKRDYLGIVGGVVGQITMPKEERMVRRAVDEAITAADRLFGEVLDGDLEELKAQYQDVDDKSAGDEPKDDSMFTDIEDDDGAEDTVDEDDDDVEDATMADGDSGEAASEIPSEDSRT